MHILYGKKPAKTAKTKGQDTVIKKQNHRLVEVRSGGRISTESKRKTEMEEG